MPWNDANRTATTTGLSIFHPPHYPTPSLVSRNHHYQNNGGCMVDLTATLGEAVDICREVESIILLDNESLRNVSGSEIKKDDDIFHGKQKQ
jgi:hypothetical protein